MSTVILLIHVMIALAMVGVILLQRSEGGALGIGGSGGGGGGMATFSQAAKTSDKREGKRSGTTHTTNGAVTADLPAVGFSILERKLQLVNKDLDTRTALKDRSGQRTPTPALDSTEGITIPPSGTSMVSGNWSGPGSLEKKSAQLKDNLRHKEYLGDKTPTDSAAGRQVALRETPPPLVVVPGPKPKVASLAVRGEEAESDKWSNLSPVQREDLKNASKRLEENVRESGVLEYRGKPKVPGRPGEAKAMAETAAPPSDPVTRDELRRTLEAKPSDSPEKSFRRRPAKQRKAKAGKDMTATSKNEQLKERYSFIRFLHL